MTDLESFEKTLEVFKSLVVNDNQVPQFIERKMLYF